MKAFPSNQQGTTIALSASVEPKSAEESINLGLEIFKDKAAPLKTRAAKALNLFNRAKGMAPNDDEMRAALYNGACCDVQLGNWDDAADGSRPEPYDGAAPFSASHERRCRAALASLPSASSVTTLPATKSGSNRSSAPDTAAAASCC